MWNLSATQQTFWLSLVTCSEPRPVAVAAFTGWCAAHGRTVLPASPETVAAFLAPDAGRGFAVNTLRLCHADLHYLHLLVGDQRSKALKIGNVERQQTLHVVIKHRRDDGGVVHLTARGAMCRKDCAAAIQHPCAVQTCVASPCAASCHNKAIVDSAARRNDAFIDKFGLGLLANRLGERP